MKRKLFAAALFVAACMVTLSASNSADAVDEAPAPRAVDDGGKKAEGKGKFGGFGGGKFDPAKLKEFKGQFDPEKLKELKGKFGKDGGFGGKGMFPGGGKGAFPFPGGEGKGGKGMFPGGKGGDKGGFGKGKKGGDKEE